MPVPGAVQLSRVCWRPHACTRTHDRASLARFRAEHAELNARIDALAAQATTARDSAQQSLLHEVESLRTRLQHMLDWRIHIGRHHFWRRPGARL